MNISNVSPVKFQGVYLNPRAEDTVNDWVNINNRRLTKDVFELKKATDAYKTERWSPSPCPSRFFPHGPSSA